MITDAQARRAGGDHVANEGQFPTTEYNVCQTLRDCEWWGAKSQKAPWVVGTVISRLSKTWCNTGRA